MISVWFLSVSYALCIHTTSGFQKKNSMNKKFTWITKNGKKKKEQANTQVASDWASIRNWIKRKNRYKNCALLWGEICLRTRMHLREGCGWKLKMKSKFPKVKFVPFKSLLWQPDRMRCSFRRVFPHKTFLSRSVSFDKKERLLCKKESLWVWRVLSRCVSSGCRFYGFHVTDICFAFLLVTPEHTFVLSQY